MTSKDKNKDTQNNYRDIEQGYVNTNNDTISVQVMIPTLNSEHLLKIYNLSQTVKLLAMIDFVFGLFMLLFGYIGLYIIIRLVLSLLGYSGAKYYHTLSVNLYLGFICFGTLLEMFLIYIYTKLYYDNSITENMYIGSVIYQSLLILLKIYICRIVCIFHNQLYYLKPSEKQDLILYDKRSIKYVIW